MRTLITVGGVALDAVDLPAATRRVDQFIRSGLPHQVVTVNLDYLAHAWRHPAFLRLLNRADLALADGKPLVWVAGQYGTPLPARVTGVDLIHTACALAAARGYRPFLLGAEPGVAAAAAARLQQRYPGLAVAGVHAPPFGAFSAAQDAAIVERVRAARPDLLFVALGAPRQDLWIDAHIAELGVPVCMGVGGAFNFIAGTVRRAPCWMQDAGLEWFFRMCQEPRRLWRRYLIDDLPVMTRLLLRSHPAVAPADPAYGAVGAAVAGQTRGAREAGRAD